MDGTLPSNVESQPSWHLAKYIMNMLTTTNKRDTSHPNVKLMKGFQIANQM